MLPSREEIEARAERRARIARLVQMANSDSFGECPTVDHEGAQILRKLAPSNGGGSPAVDLDGEEDTVSP